MVESFDFMVQKKTGYSESTIHCNNIAPLLDNKS